MQRLRITLKTGYVETDLAGRIVLDRSVGRDYACAPHDGWKITGIGRRFNSRYITPLIACVGAPPSELGHGFVHDIDHGTRRMWCQPSSRRAIKVEKIG